MTITSTLPPGRELADYLFNKGVCVIALPPHGGSEESAPEFSFPVGWDKKKPSAQNYKDYVEDWSGLAMRAGLIDVIDIDMTGAAADAYLERIENAGFPIIAVVRTPGEGYHVWVPGGAASKTRWEVKTTASSGRGHVDFLANGSLVYIPGCHRPKYEGRGYVFVKPPLDDLVRLAREDERRLIDTWIENERGTPVLPEAPLPRRTVARRAAVKTAVATAVPEWLLEELGKPTPEGQRSERFASLLRKLKSAGCDEDQAIELITPWCELNGKYVGREEREVARIWDRIEVEVKEKKEEPTAPLPTRAEKSEDADFTLKDVQPDSPLPYAGKMSEEEFWNSRDYLRYVREYAYAYQEAPYALLLSVLVRISGDISPGWVLPRVINTQASLNYYGILLDNSGGGKSGCMDMAETMYAWSAPVVPGLTSGEGLLTEYTERTKVDGVWETQITNRNLVFALDEVGALHAVDSRHGNQLLGNLRTLWTKGGGFGRANEAQDKKHRLPSHSVRTAIIIGAQPTQAGKLLEDEGAGTAERFVVMRLEDENIPVFDEDAEDALAAPEDYRLPVRIAQVGTPLAPPEGRPREVVYDRRISVLLKKTRNAQKRGADVEANIISPAAKYGKVNGHRLLILAKTAALFALWDGRKNITYEDWGLAVHFITLSTETREWALGLVSNARAANNRAAGHAKGHRALAAEEVIREVGVKETLQAVLSKLRVAENGELSKGRLKSQISKAKREFLEDALEAGATEARLMVVVEQKPGNTVETVRLL